MTAVDAGLGAAAAGLDVRNRGGLNRGDNGSSEAEDPYDDLRRKRFFAGRACEARMEAVDGVASTVGSSCVLLLPSEDDETDGAAACDFRLVGVCAGGGGGAPLGFDGVEGACGELLRRRGTPLAAPGGETRPSCCCWLYGSGCRPAAARGECVAAAAGWL